MCVERRHESRVEPFTIARPYTYGSYMLPTGVKDWWDRQATVIYNTDGSTYATYIGDQYTYYTNNAQGQPTSVDGPRTDVTDVWTAQYDNMGRETLRVAPAVAPNPSDATKTTYDLMGRVTKVERGTYMGSTFTPLEMTTTDYDAVGNAIKVTTPAGVTQMSYDAANRVKCTALRMNPAVYGSLPADACAPSTVGTNGPDRIMRNTYDAAGRVTQVEMGVGSPMMVLYSRTTYTANGKPATLTDANNNKSAYAYDGFDRLKRLYFPSATRGMNLASTTDYEEYGYDANGNRTSLRKRGDQAGNQTIVYQYDALNRLRLKDIPGGVADDVMHTYAPGGGPLTQLTYGSPSQPGLYLTYTYDAMGRVSEGGVQNIYDAAGNRTQVHRGNQNIYYAYDVLNRMTTIQFREDGVPSATNVATLTYGALNRRSGITRANGANTSYSYDAAGRLSGITHVGVPASTGSAQTFGYNPASQTISASQSNSLFQWSGQPVSTKNATHDGLNRDAAVVAAAGYDANGNLTFDGTRTFTYDVENRLRTVTGPGLDLSLQYDPQGRLMRLNADGAQVGYYSYNGSEIVYAGGLGQGQSWSYIAGPGTDEYIAGMYYPLGVGVTFAQLHADRQGSIIGTSDSTGAITPLTYGPYGEPQTWAGQVVRYTGQVAIPQAQLYYYKARMYDPMIGRFMQTDPIGYEGGLNIYAYVGGDPVNRTDPTGLRPPTPGEIAILEPIFGTSIDYSSVDIRDGSGLNPIAFGALVTGTPAITLNNTIYVRSDLFREDYSLPGEDRGLFAHEITHIFQYNNYGISPSDIAMNSISARLRGSDPYGISIVQSYTDWNSLGYEQQAAVIEAYINALRDGDTVQIERLGPVVSQGLFAFTQVGNQGFTPPPAFGDYGGGLGSIWMSEWYSPRRRGGGYVEESTVTIPGYGTYVIPGNGS